MIIILSPSLTHPRRPFGATQERTGLCRFPGFFCDHTHRPFGATSELRDPLTLPWNYSACRSFAGACVVLRYTCLAFWLQSSAVIICCYQCDNWYMLPVVRLVVSLACLRPVVRGLPRRHGMARHGMAWIAKKWGAAPFAPACIISYHAHLLYPTSPTSGEESSRPLASQRTVLQFANHVSE